VSGLFATLGNSVKALTAHSRAIETTGKNLANVNNPSYARQRVIYGDRGTVQTPQGPESMGIEALGVQQLRDTLLDKQILREIALKSSYEAEQSGYQRAQAGLGESVDRASSTAGAGGADHKGLSAALDDFFNAFGSFAARPTDFGERQALLQKANILSDRFQLADQRLAAVQVDLDSAIATDVSDVNQLLQTIADLNGQIGRFEINAPGSAVDLRDQRQARLEELAAKIPIEIAGSTGGMVQVVAKDGSGGNVVLVDLATVQRTVAFTGTAFTAGTPATTLALTGGSMKGALTARDGAVQTLRNDLDALAKQLVISVNAAYNPTGSTGDFFTAANQTAGTISVDPSVNTTSLKASDGGAAGDNSLALAVAQLANQGFATSASDEIDGSFSEFFSKTVSKLGQALAGANSRVDDQTNIEQLVRAQRDGISGVSLDEEMADLLKYQRAFQASSRVFSVIDELLDNVVNRLGL
jgi:flagellar hook-associated protein 1 FlgK